MIEHNEVQLVNGMKIDKECPSCHYSAAYHSITKEYRCNELANSNKRYCGWFKIKIGEVIWKS